MSEFENREKAFEKKFELDEELKFKISARAAKLIGLWVASELGLSGAGAEAYAQQVIAADLSEPGHEDLLKKIAADLSAKGVQHPHQELQRRYEDALRTAEAQMKASVAV